MNQPPTQSFKAEFEAANTPPPQESAPKPAEQPQTFREKALQKFGFVASPQAPDADQMATKIEGYTGPLPVESPTVDAGPEADKAQLENSLNIPEGSVTNHLAELKGMLVDVENLQNLDVADLVKTFTDKSSKSPREVLETISNFQTGMKDIKIAGVDVKGKDVDDAVHMINKLLSEESTAEVNKMLVDLEAGVSAESAQGEVSVAGEDEAQQTSEEDPEADTNVDASSDTEAVQQSSKLEKFLEDTAGDNIGQKYKKAKDTDEFKQFWGALKESEKADFAEHILDDLTNNVDDISELTPEQQQELKDVLAELADIATEKKKKKWGEKFVDTIKFGMDGSDMDLFIQALITGNTSGGMLASRFEGFRSAEGSDMNEVGLSDFKDKIKMKDSDSRQEKMRKWINLMIVFLEKSKVVDADIEVFKGQDFPNPQEFKDVMKKVEEVFKKLDVQKINKHFKEVAESKTNGVEFSWGDKDTVGKEIAMMVSMLSKHDSYINTIFGTQQPT